MARTWLSDGCGLPCNNKQKTNDLCGTHLNHNKYGLIDKKPSSTLNWKTDATQFNKTDILTPDTYTTYKHFQDAFKSFKKPSSPVSNTTTSTPTQPISANDIDDDIRRDTVILL